MKKILLSLACVLGLTAGAAEVTTEISQPGSGVSTWGTETTWSQEGFTFTAKKNNSSSNPTFNTKSGDLRIYAKGSLTIAGTGNILAVDFHLSAQGLKRDAPITCDTGEVAAQTAGETNITWSGAASTVTFTVGEKAEYGTDGSSKAGQFDVDVITITYEGSDGPTVASVVFTPGAGKVMPGTEVTLSCPTEGAEIHYMIDEGPDASSPLYTAPIVVEFDCTIQAIAIKDGVASPVSSAEYIVLDPMNSIGDAASLKNNEVFAAGFDSVVVYTNGLYNYIYDGFSYGLIYGDIDVEVGDIIAEGWMGTVSIYNSLVEFKPSTEVALSIMGKGEVPAPTLITPNNYETVYTSDYMNAYVKVNSMVTQAVEGSDIKMTGVAEGCEFVLYNRFGLEYGEGEYNVTGFISVYKTEIQIYPIEMASESAITGDIDGDGEVGISDISALIDMIVSGEYNTAGDLDGDGQIGVADISALIDIILK